MGLLKGLWNGLGDLYDSVDNTSNDDYNDNSIRQGSRKVRVTWRGNYKSTAGYWCTADVDEVISEDMEEETDPEEMAAYEKELEKMLK